MILLLELPEGARLGNALSTETDFGLLTSRAVLEQVCVVSSY